MHGSMNIKFKILYIYNAIKMTSIIIITYLVVLHVMLRLDCIIEVSHWGILRIEFNPLVTNVIYIWSTHS